MLSIFDIYKIGVGPSSSHTNGPMIAGFHFTQLIADKIAEVTRVQVDLYGSLSLTGIGHHTDRATILGLLGNKPDTIKITSANQAMRHAVDSGEMDLAGTKHIAFNYETDMLFHKDNLPLHENGMMITAFDQSGNVIVDETYYSIGGGFIATADELQNGTQTQAVEVPFPFKNADEMLQHADNSGMSLGGMILKNEAEFEGADIISEKADQIWRVMRQLLAVGTHDRAAALDERLTQSDGVGVGVEACVAQVETGDMPQLGAVLSFGAASEEELGLVIRQARADEIGRASCRERVC